MSIREESDIDNLKLNSTADFLSRRQLNGSWGEKLKGFIEMQ
jgi:hypothetical protein